jgi:hypothetical protein
VSGADGEGGPGKEQGDPGGVQFHGVSNAGDGDDGIPHGDGGGAGQDGVTAKGPIDQVEESFRDGEDGNDCPVPPKYSAIHHIGGLLSSDPWVLARGLMPAPWTGDFLHMYSDFLGIPRAMDHTTIMELGGQVLDIDAAAASILDFYFACGGTEPFSFTRCAEDGPMDPGEYVAISIVLHGELPGSSDKWYQYAVVFDQDGIESNNFRAVEPFGRDGADNTDRVYDLSHNPTDGWVIRAGAFDAATGGGSVFPSKARLISDGRTLVLLIPKGEFAADLPKYRITTLCHEGDFGLQGGPFSGDHQTPVGQDLLQVGRAAGSQ